MKIWIRIIVAVCVIVVIAFGVWAFFIKEDEEVQAYNRTAELIDYKQSIGISESLISLRELDYLNNDNANKISTETETGSSIIEIRRLILNNDLILGYGENAFYSYLAIDGYVDEVLEYYLPYTRGDNVKSKSLRALKSEISDYVKCLKNVNSKIDELVEYQSVITGSAVELEILLGYYGQLQSLYRSSLNHASNVIMSVMNYIDKSVYNDNFLIDTTTALYDSFARAVNVSTSVESKLEPDYANDVRIILDRVNRVRKGESIYSETYNEYNFLKAYNNLYNNHLDTINFVLSCKNIKKNEMSEGHSIGEIVSSIQGEVITVVNILGF